MTYIKPPASYECKWRSGPPPDVGWWPASALRRPYYLRYWNGTFWSWGAISEESRRTLKSRAYKDIAGSHQHEIEWTDRWWLK